MLTVAKLTHFIYGHYQFCYKAMLNERSNITIHLFI